VFGKYPFHYRISNVSWWQQALLIHHDFERINLLFLLVATRLEKFFDATPQNQLESGPSLQRHRITLILLKAE
jgi:hypothetical protein